MQKVVDTLLPKAEPVEEAARTGAVKPKTPGAPAPTPPTVAQTAPAAQTKARNVPLGSSSSRSGSTGCLSVLYASSM